MLRSQRLGLGRGGLKPVSLVHSWWKRYFGFERTKSVLGVGWLRLPRAVIRHMSYCSLRPTLMLYGVPHSSQPLTTDKGSLLATGIWVGGGDDG